MGETAAQTKNLFPPAYSDKPLGAPYTPKTYSRQGPRVLGHTGKVCAKLTGWKQGGPVGGAPQKSLPGGRKETFSNA